MQPFEHISACLSLFTRIAPTGWVFNLEGCVEVDLIWVNQAPGMPRIRESAKSTEC